MEIYLKYFYKFLKIFFKAFQFLKIFFKLQKYFFKFFKILNFLKPLKNKNAEKLVEPRIEPIDYQPSTQTIMPQSHVKTPCKFSI